MDGKQIKEVRPDGILYQDTDGTTGFISFGECYENYVRKYTEPEFWERYIELNNLSDEDFEKHVTRVKTWKEVGARQPPGPPRGEGPYIEFHPEPPIRLRFKTEEEYRQTLVSLAHHGWVTLDLS